MSGPPKYFLKKYPEKTFNKKILSRIFSKQQNDFLLKVFQKDKNNLFTLKSELTKEEIKTLKKIKKVIKSNTGVTQKGKLTILCIIVGAILIFNFFFKDALIESSLEIALQSLFNAKAEISGLTFDIFNAKISLASLKVANSEKPYRNLIDLGKTEVHLHMNELLKGKFVVRNLECQAIKWNTERNESGILIIKDNIKPNSEEEKKDKPLFNLDIKGIDAGNIIESEKKNLKSFSTVSDLNENLSKLSSKYSKATESYKDDLDDLSKSVTEISRINPKKLKTIKEVRNSITKIDSGLSKLNKLKTAISKTSSQINKDISEIDKEVKNIQSTIKEDKNYLTSFINAPQEKATSIFSGVADQFLKNNLGEFYIYVQKAIDALKNLDQQKKLKNKEFKPKSNKGYKLQFPGKGYPNFMIENASFSIGNKSDPFFISTTLKNISSAPDLIDNPASLSFEFKENSKTIRLNGFADIKEDASQLFSIDFKADDYPISIKKGLEFIGIQSFTTNISYITTLSTDRNNTTSGNIFIKLKDISIKIEKDAGEIAKKIIEVFEETDVVTIDSSIALIEENKFKLNIKSNIDELISKKIGNMIDDFVNESKEKLISEFNKLLSPSLKEKDRLYSGFIDIKKVLDTDMSKINGYKKSIDKKKQEIKKEANNIQKGIEKKVDEYIPKIDMGF